MANNGVRILKNSIWLYLKMGISMSVAFFSTRLILISLGAEDFGIYQIVGGVIGMLGFLNAAMARATQRYMSYAEGEKNIDKKLIIFNTSYFLHFIIAIIAVVTLLFVGCFCFDSFLNIPRDRIPAAEIVYGSLVVSTFFTIIAVPYDAVLNAHENMLFYAIVGIIESILKLIIAFACVYTSSDKLIVYGLLMAFVPIVTRIIMSYYCHRYYEECRISFKNYWSASTFRDISMYAGWNFLGSFGNLVGNYGQSIILNHYFGVLVNAASGIVVQVQGQMMALTTNMQKALDPVIVKKEATQERESMLEWSLRGCKFSFLLISLISIPLCFEADYLLKLWLKEVPEWTTLFLVIHMIRILIEQSTQSLTTALGATGNIKGLNIQCIIFLICPLFVTSGLFELGVEPYWLYVVMMLSAIIQSLFKLFLCKKHCNLSFLAYFKSVFLPIFYFLIPMCIVCYMPQLFMDEGILRLLLVIVLSCITLCITAFNLSLDGLEKQFIIELIKKVKR